MSYENVLSLICGVQFGLIVLKVCGVIMCPWLVVLWPTIICVGLPILLVVIVLILAWAIGLQIRIP